MSRRRALRLTAALLCALVLVGLGARYFWLRDQRRHTEETVASLTREAAQALHVLRRLEGKRVSAEKSNAAVQADRDRIRALAASLHDNLSRARADTTAAEVGAFTSGAQANNLRACLTGVSQALNQLAVGDGRSIASLSAVETPCRAVGIV